MVIPRCSEPFNICEAYPLLGLILLPRLRCGPTVISRDAQPPSGPNRDGRRPTNFGPNRTELIQSVWFGPFVSPGPTDWIEVSRFTAKNKYCFAIPLLRCACGSPVPISDCSGSLFSCVAIPAVLQ